MPSRTAEQGPSIDAGESVGQLLVGEDLLHQQRVDVHESGLQQVEGEHGHLLGLLVRPGQVAVLAVEEVLVRAVPVLQNLQALVDLLPEFDVGEVVADECRAHRPPEFLGRLVGGVLGATAGEAPQDLLGLAGS
ncbi:hypothetical protein [Streptomyces sp. OspMP-M43]|uniref:hypothetical protein n=1 Tax=Streptomyces sp. OspMP-M43 TaxID=1839781 RepID=UPI00159F228B|nr:hypothetical protein [Streptomyces sp. OspMP-M43]